MKILLHICCSNCALYPLKMIQSDGHSFSGFWFNPNIHPIEEHTLRLESLKKLAGEWRVDMLPVDKYEPEKYFKMFKSKNPPSPPFTKGGKPSESPLQKGANQASLHFQEGKIQGSLPLKERTGQLSPTLKKGDLGGFEVEAQTVSVPPSPERCRSCYELRLEKTAEQARTNGFEAFTTTLLISPYQDIEGIETIGKMLANKYNIQFYFRDFRPYFREAMTLARELGLYRQKYCGCIFSREERKQKGGGRRDMREKDSRQ